MGHIESYYHFLPLSTTPISCQSGAKVAFRKRIPQGIVLKVQPLGDCYWDRPQIAAFHGKFYFA
jgi:hypothetical protein